MATENSYVFLIRETYNSISNNLKVPGGHLHYTPMKCKEAIKTGDMFPFCKKAKGGKCKEAKVRMPQQKWYLQKIPLTVNILLYHVSITFTRMSFS